MDQIRIIRDILCSIHIYNTSRSVFLVSISSMPFYGFTISHRSLAGVTTELIFFVLFCIFFSSHIFKPNLNQEILLNLLLLSKIKLYLINLSNYIATSIVFCCSFLTIFLDIFSTFDFQLCADLYQSWTHGCFF